jgi:hypothetical protein
MNTCKICQKEIQNPNGFGNHIKQFHKIEIKEYYDFYLKKENDGKCKHCMKETTFLSVINGYRIHCSKSCSKHYQNTTRNPYIMKEGHEAWNKGKPMSETYYKNFCLAMKKANTGRSPWNKGIKMSTEFKEQWIKIMWEKTWKKHTPETVAKMRINMVNKLNLLCKDFHPPYNKNGCMYFEQMMKDSNIFIQHAENFGEFHIKELGYWVDGYDKENNVVYEWDEKWHYKDNLLRDKDLKRQREIEKLLGCTFIRIKEI